MLFSLQASGSAYLTEKCDFLTRRSKSGKQCLEVSNTGAEIRSWGVTCSGVESHSEASFPSLQPEDVASLVEGSWGGYGAQPVLRWMSHAKDMCLLSYLSACVRVCALEDKSMRTHREW